MNIADEIEHLHRLKESGAITEEEFAQAKQRVLAGELPPDRPAAAVAPADRERQTRDWATYLHLSQLLGLLVPLGGLVALILIWQLKKDDLPGLDAHGRAVLNWVLSALIYFVGAALLSLIVIGLPLLLTVIILSIVFPIVGAVKANDGELWQYPLSIRFLRAD